MRKSTTEMIKKIITAGVMTVTAAVSLTGCNPGRRDDPGQLVYDAYYTVKGSFLNGEWVSEDENEKITINCGRYTICDQEGSVKETGTVKSYACDCLDMNYELFPDNEGERMILEHITEDDGTEKLESSKMITYVLK